MAGTVFGAMLAPDIMEIVQVAAVDRSLAGVLAGSLLIMAFVGFWEALVFRGCILQNRAQGMGMKTATIISCVVYALVHSANPNASLSSTAIIMFFGDLRTYGYPGNGQLRLSSGLHTGWNLFQATVFGFAASGHAEDRTLLPHDSVSAANRQGFRHVR